jgi:F-box protein 1 (cyclin F)
MDLECDTKTVQGFTTLPDELLVYVFAYLPAVDLLKLELVCRRFNHVVLSCGQLWKRASLAGVWPSDGTRNLLQRCERAGNVEALIKGAIAHLYSESRSAAGRDEAVHGLCSEKAARLFIATDESHLHRPFTWLLYRSPWAPGGSCCKAAVFRHVQALCDPDRHLKATSNMLYCVAKAMSFNEVGLSVCLPSQIVSVKVSCSFAV